MSNTLENWLDFRRGEVSEENEGCVDCGTLLTEENDGEGIETEDGFICIHCHEKYI